MRTVLVRFGQTSVVWALACGDGPGMDDLASTATDTMTEGTGTDGGTDSGSTHATGATSSSTGADSTEGSTGSTGDPCDCRPGSCPVECPESLAAEVGFVEIEPISFVLHADADSQAFSSSAARLWYGFQPADEAPASKPIAVLFNGGPGAASEVLFAFNTSKYSFDEMHNGGGEVGPSPASWTSALNVLYIDARTTGFSYNLMNNPADPSARQAEFTVHNFNSYLDAADFVRVVLRFLAAHPQLRGNEIVLVGESYGGVRATAMLDLLLDYQAHAGSSTPYEDDALVQEIQEHFDQVFPTMAGEVFPPAKIAEQFSRQILVQPLVLGERQFDVTGNMHDAPGSVIFQIAADVGQTFVPCSQKGGTCDPYGNAISFVEGTANRDRFAYPYPFNWLFDRIDSLAPKLSQVALASEMFMVDPAGVPWLYAAERTGAYRTAGTFPLVSTPHRDTFLWRPRPHELLMPDFSLAGAASTIDGDFPAIFGDLEPWDTYYLSSNYAVLNMFYSNTAYSFAIDPYSDVFGRAFLRNLVHVDTFITNAAYDLVIWGPSIPEAMKSFSSEIAAVSHDQTGPAGAERPGQVIVDFQAGAFGLPGGASRTIRFPYYDDSSHTVTLNQPVELLADVVDWLSP